MPLIELRDVRKVYRLGEVDVEALKTVSVSRSATVVNRARERRSECPTPSADADGVG